MAKLHIGHVIYTKEITLVQVLTADGKKSLVPYDPEKHRGTVEEDRLKHRWSEREEVFFEHPELEVDRTVTSGHDYENNGRPHKRYVYAVSKKVDPQKLAKEISEGLGINVGGLQIQHNNNNNNKIVHGYMNTTQATTGETIIEVILYNFDEKSGADPQYPHHGFDYRKHESFDLDHREQIKRICDQHVGL